MKCPTYLRSTPLNHIFNALFRDNPFAYFLSRATRVLCVTVTVKSVLILSYFSKFVSHSNCIIEIINYTSIWSLFSCPHYDAHCGGGVEKGCDEGRAEPDSIFSPTSLHVPPCFSAGHLCTVQPLTINSFTCYKNPKLNCLSEILAFIASVAEGAAKLLEALFPGFNHESTYSETKEIIHYPSVIPIAKLGPYSCSDPIFRWVRWSRQSQSEAASSSHASNLPFSTID